MKINLNRNKINKRILNNKTQIQVLKRGKRKQKNHREEIEINLTLKNVKLERRQDQLLKLNHKCQVKTN